jgi:hypothetical protein
MMISNVLGRRRGWILETISHDEEIAYIATMLSSSRPIHALALKKSRH